MVPADIGFFAELRNGTDLLTPLTEPQIWTLLAELAGQPAAVEEASSWREQIKRTVRMEPAEAIRTLFSQRVSFASRGPGQSQDAVVLCRPMADLPAATWPGRWQAKPVSGYGTDQTFQLSGNIGVAAVRDVLLFGDLLAPDATFKQLVQFAADSKGAPSLDANPDYRALRERLDQDLEGLLYLRIGGRRPAVTAPQSAPAQTAPASSSAPVAASPDAGGLDFPGALRGARTVLLGLRRVDHWLDLSVVGDVRATQPPLASQPAAKWISARLPADTVVFWEGEISYRGLVQSVEALPERNALRAAYRLLQQQQLLEPVLEMLEDRACVTMGWVRNSSGPTSAATESAPATSAPSSGPTSPPRDIPLPALGLLAPVRDEAEAARRVGELIDATATVLDFVTLARGGKPLSRGREADFNGTPVHVLDLSRVLSEEAARYYPLELSWTVQGGCLIVTTNLDWLKSIVAARTAANEPEAGCPTWTAQDRSRVLVRTGLLADAGQRWLDYIAQAYPALMQENWWRNWQSQPTRLGIDVSAEPDAKRLRVTRVAAEGSASGLLFEGDLLLGTRVRRFTTTQPIAEMRTLIDSRPHSSYLDVLVERGQQTRFVRVPLPYFDPVRSLRRVVAIGRVFERITYADQVVTDGFGRSRLGLGLQGLIGTMRPATSQPAPPPAGK